MALWLLAYCAVGAGCAVAGDRRRTGAGRWARVSAWGLALLLWPLWAPVALWPDPEPKTSPGAPAPVTQQVQAALAEARAAVSGSELDSLLPVELAEAVLASARQLELRANELRAVLLRLDSRGPAELSASATQRREQNVARLRSLLTRDERMLSELLQMAEALHLQLLLARFSGHSAEVARQTATELGAQVEVFDAFLELDPEPTSAAGAPTTQAENLRPKAEVCTL